jgi:hypothetical protein
MSTTHPTQPGLYAKSCRFDGCPVLVLFSVTQAQLEHWRMLSGEVERLGALEISLGQAPHPGYGLAIEGQGFSECSDYAHVTGWDHTAIDRIISSEDWCCVEVDEPQAVIAALYAISPDPKHFELFQLDLMRVNAQGYVQPTVEQESDDSLLILSPIFPLAQDEAKPWVTVHAMSGLGMRGQVAA